MSVAPKEQQWDPLSGCWIADGSAVDIPGLPKPLYVMGYGSLLWKPGPLLENLRLTPVKCPGYHRLFAQRSCDHRGTPAFPGLVLTLVSDEYVSANSASGLDGDSGISSTASNNNSNNSNNNSNNSNNSSNNNSNNNSNNSSRGGGDSQCNPSNSQPQCLAGVFEVTDEATIPELIAYLDEREKGGYSPAIVTVELLQATSSHKAGEEVKALVYLGESDNPNFYFPKSLSPECYLNRISSIISASSGPSGFNTEYLFKLVNYLSGLKFYDDHLNEIAFQVWKKISYFDKEGWQISRRRLMCYKDNLIYINSRYNYLLSSFAFVEGGIQFRGMTYPSVEHAYQSLKFEAEDRLRFTIDGDLGSFVSGLAMILDLGPNPSANQIDMFNSYRKRYMDNNLVGILAKEATRENIRQRLGLRLNKDENEYKINSLWMEEILKSKYSRSNKKFRDALIASGDKYLIVHDRQFQITKKPKFWKGAIVGGRLVGLNHMGRLLMKVRNSIREEVDDYNLSSSSSNISISSDSCGSGSAESGITEGHSKSTAPLNEIKKNDDSFVAWASSLVQTSVIGCGSNEHNQIDPRASTESTPLLSFCKDVSFLDMLYYKPLVNSTDQNNSSQLLNISKCFAGGSISAVLTDSNVLILYGNLSLLPSIAKLLKNDSHDVAQLLTSDLKEKTVEIIAISDVHSCSIGFEHVAVLFIDGHVLCLGDDSFGQCTGCKNANKQDHSQDMAVDSDTVIYPTINSKLPDLNAEKLGYLLSMDSIHENLVIPVFSFHKAVKSQSETNETNYLSFSKISTGYRHTVGLSVDLSQLFLWGDCSKGQCGACGCVDKASSKESLRNKNMRSINISNIDSSSKFIDSTEISASSQEYDNRGPYLETRCIDFRNGLLNDTQSDCNRFSYFQWSFGDKGIKWMDVACGAYFTVAIDTLGRVWSVGDNRYGQLGRTSSEPPTTNKKSSKFDSCPRIIPNLDYDNVKYDKVTCGVSHAVLHGVTLEGENVFVALGRSDMGQYPRKESNSGDMLLWRLKPLPKPSTTIGNQSVREDWMGDIAHVWCGSEFIYACDYSGYLYSAGWGDHGNLGSVDVNVNPPTSSLVQDNSDMTEEGKHSGVALTNGCVLEWAPVLVEPSPGYLPSLNSSEATTCTASHVCLGEYSSSSSVSCGGGHTLIKITKKMHAE